MKIIHQCSWCSAGNVSCLFLQFPLLMSVRFSAPWYRVPAGQQQQPSWVRSYVLFARIGTTTSQIKSNMVKQNERRVWTSERIGSVTTERTGAQPFLRRIVPWKSTQCLSDSLSLLEPLFVCVDMYESTSAVGHHHVSSTHANRHIMSLLALASNWFRAMWLSAPFHTHHHAGFPNVYRTTSFSARLTSASAA